MRRLCPPAAATSSARFAVSCPLMSFKSGIASSPGSGVVPAQGLKPLEVIDELKQVRGREDRHVGCSPRGFGAVRSWTDQALAERVGPDRGRKRAGDGRYRPVERKLSEHAIALDCIARDRANRGHQAKRDGKVVVTSFLGEIGGSEIDGDACRRKPESDRVKRSANTLAPLGDCLVGKADEGEGRDARGRSGSARRRRAQRSPRKRPTVVRANSQVVNARARGKNNQRTSEMSWAQHRGLNRCLRRTRMARC